MKGYKEVLIKNINSEESKISISGFIVTKDDTNLVIDDNTGVLRVDIENSFSVNDYVRVFGNLIKNEDNLILKGEVIQNLNEVNKEIHRKVKGLL